MSGDIWITRQLRWPVNDSLYNWVLDFLIDRTADADALAELEEVRDENLGVVVVEDFPQAVRAAMVAAIRDDLVPEAEKRLPGDEWAEFRDELSKLAELAEADSPGSKGPE
ncbi:hypothetical protein [Actinokineospora xionganensis]|uniref:CdiI immunity protein domain-containing protein n=1 Tax=Actinokineospora xionganensis TaxID=2684470 RepID=A0ABR7LH79_9PSEU|nr:hypothetical protein [Actinokineospora xionganensis]MBC6451731.1 hypothetical protein [Actinokineospora xionganensis]